MARATGDLLDLLHKCRHHAITGSVNHGGRMLYLSLSLEEKENEIGDAIKYRFDLMKEELQTAIDQIEKIKKLAEEKGLTEVTAILNEEVEFGHDFSDTPETPEKPTAPSATESKDAKIHRLFKEKIADPFNSAFGHIINNRGQKCFNISVLEGKESGSYAPEDLAQGRMYPLEATDDYYKVSLFFYTNGEACACLNREKPNRIDDNHEKILMFALTFIEAELENTGRYPDDLAKVKIAIDQLEKKETPEKPEVLRLAR